MISLTKIGLLYTIKIFVIEQRQININREKEKVMTITEKMYLSDVFSLDNKVVLSTISSQLTAHSSQLTAHKV